MLGDFGQIIAQNTWWAFPVALFAGIVSSFSPCVLATIPLLVGYVAGCAGSDHKRAWWYSLCFCLGLVMTLTAMGAAAAALGKLLLLAGSWWFILLGMLMLLFGLEMLGIARLIARSCRLPGRQTGLGGAFLLGILGGALASPCATPVLAAILAFVASKADVLFGVALLTTYSIGHCFLILVAETSVGLAQ